MFKYLALLLLYKSLGWLPTRAAYFIAGIAASASYYLRPGLRRRVRSNVEQVMGPNADPKSVRATVKRILHNVTYYYADLLLLPRMDIDKFYRNNLTLVSFENLDNARRSGRAVVLVSAHYGNPELVIQAGSAIGLKVFGLTEPLQPKRLSDFVHKIRASKGQVLKPVSMSTVKEVIRLLNSGGIVSLLCDRDIQHTGIVVPFCGKETCMPVGTAQLAMRTKAIVIPMFTRRTRLDHFEIYAEPPIEMEFTGDNDRDVQVNTQRILAVVERFLRMDPGQWLVTEQVWDDMAQCQVEADSPAEAHRL